MLSKTIPSDFKIFSRAKENISYKFSKPMASLPAADFAISVNKVLKIGPAVPHIVEIKVIPVVFKRSLVFAGAAFSSPCITFLKPRAIVVP